MAKKDDTTLIECAICEAKVSAAILSIKESFNEDENVPTQIYFLECSVCKEVMLGYSEVIRIGDDEWDYEKPVRLWPKPKKFTSWKLPLSVRDSIDEARKCSGAKVYSACVVMCGKALESICKEHKIKDWKLQKGLFKLKEKGVIDGRLFEWGEALRKSRNIGAHATDRRVTRQDAEDILDFTIAICDYVYVLTDRYNSFMKRQLDGDK